MEQPKNMVTKSIQKRIKNVLGFFGIEGEVGFASPARSVEEHTEIALAKNYSTIVAVGSDKIINRIASLLKGKDRVLGIIPIDASEDITNLIGATKIEDACQALKFRKIRSLNLAYIEPSKFFLSRAQVQINKPCVVDINVDNYFLQTKVTHLEIVSSSVSPDGYIAINFKNSHEGPNFFIQGLYTLFGKKITDIYSSVLRGRKILINTSEPLAVIIDQEIIAKTPISLASFSRPLKIIVSRANISGNEK